LELALVRSGRWLAVATWAEPRRWERWSRSARRLGAGPEVVLAAPVEQTSAGKQAGLARTRQ
jgi:hypothetical protein